MTYVATTLLYPCALAALCLGAGLLVECASGWELPASLLGAAGAALLIGVTQLTTLPSFLAPATPYVMLAAALLGAVAGRRRLPALARIVRSPAVALPVGAYAIALAPVLAAGRPTFSAFMALSDSAVHLIGADYLLHHGQSYGHLDLHNSYGLFIKAYYGSGYPSGADTLFGASAGLLGLPLIWAFQPFSAFMLATATGPAWLLARRLGLGRAWAAAAALSATLGALVYAYELIGSIKELTALPMLLTAGALLTLHRRWLDGRPGGLIPLALVLAAGVSALGPAFGVWALTAFVVLALVAADGVRRGTLRVGSFFMASAVAAVVGGLAVLPTLRELSQSLSVAGAIASTGNPGNLRAPLHAYQAFGVWLGGSYKLDPTGAGWILTLAAVAVAGAAALVGAATLLVRRRLVVAGWFALVLLAWLIVARSVTTWAAAKTLVLSSPVVVLLVWAGVGELLRGRRAQADLADREGRRAEHTREVGAGADGVLLLQARRGVFVRSGGAPAARGRHRLFAVAGVVVAVALLAATLASDALQYRSTNLAPTARYVELARVGRMFSGRGPAIFTDFDEYSMYELRREDIGGPDFAQPPPALAAAAGGYGLPLDLGAVKPGAFAAYPLIVTRRDPTAERPPAAYRLAWRGAYYEVWAREEAAHPALAHLALPGGPAAQCARIGADVALAPRGTAALAAATAPALIEAPLPRGRAAPAGWASTHFGLVMGRKGHVTVSVELPSAGTWELWAQGEFMPRISFLVDGRPVGSYAGQLSGNTLRFGAPPPLTLHLRAGRHTVTVVRPGYDWSPGSRGAAILHALLLVPAGRDEPALRTVPAASWHALCGGRYQWLELLGR